MSLAFSRQSKIDYILEYLKADDQYLVAEALDVLEDCIIKILEKPPGTFLYLPCEKDSIVRNANFICESEVYTRCQEKLSKLIDTLKEHGVIN